MDIKKFIVDIIYEFSETAVFLNEYRTDEGIIFVFMISNPNIRLNLVYPFLLPDSYEQLDSEKLREMIIDQIPYFKK